MIFNKTGNIKKDSSGIRRILPLPGVTASVRPTGLTSRQPPAIQTNDSFGIVGENQHGSVGIVWGDHHDPVGIIRRNDHNSVIIVWGNRHTSVGIVGETSVILSVRVDTTDCCFMAESHPLRSII